MYAASRCDAATVSRLLDADANAHLRDITGKSALHYAATSGNIKCLNMLLASSVDVNCQDNRGCTALHYITTSKNYDREAIDCVLTAGADANVQNVHGASPLELCAFSDDSYSARALLDAGASIDAPDYEGDTPLCEAFYCHADNVLELLISYKAAYTPNDSHGNSILHQAALYGGLRTLDILIDSDLGELDPDALNREGKTPRQLAEERMGTEIGFIEKMNQLLAQIWPQNGNLRDSRQTDVQGKDSPAVSAKGTPRVSLRTGSIHSWWVIITKLKERIGQSSFTDCYA